MLNIKNLKSGYNGAEILHGIEMKIMPMEIVAVIGPNGSGKSTILKSIFGLAEIYSGKIALENKSITKLPAYKLITLGIGYVPQGRQIFPSLTVSENLEMGAYVIADKKIALKNIESILMKFPMLREKQRENAGILSGGQQQILAVARALVCDPQLLLLDEPSLGLSPKAMKEIFEMIKKIREEGVTVIIVEQNAKRAVEIADRTYVLENGSIILEGGREIIKNPKIKSVYLG